MRTIGTGRSRSRAGVTAFVGLLLVASAGTAAAAPGTQISQDPYTNSTSQHQTEVEPATASFGDSVLAVFQAGRFAAGGGSSNIGWAYSADKGVSWDSGFLPGLTVHSTPSGSADRATNASAAYDATHQVWLVASLTLKGWTPSSGIVVSRSTDGRAWQGPVDVSAPNGTFRHDKSWITCDNGSTSPFAGRCYVSWTRWDDGGTILTSRSSDGGQTWSTPVASEDGTKGTGVQLVVRPDGTVVVLALDFEMTSVRAFRSTDGGASFGPRAEISNVAFRRISGLRADPFPSAGVDSSGRIYVVWSDCRFRAGCPQAPNDLVIATSGDGLSWSAVSKLPLSDGTTESDRILPALDVDGSTLALTYFSFDSSPNGSCSLSPAQTSSTDAGATWRPSEALSSQPMCLLWLPSTELGRMVGDYVSTSIVSGRAVSVFPLATSPPSPGTFSQHMAAASVELVASPPLAPADPLGQLLAALLSLLGL